MQWLCQQMSLTGIFTYSILIDVIIEHDVDFANLEIIMHNRFYSYFVMMSVCHETEYHYS